MFITILINIFALIKTSLNKIKLRTVLFVLIFLLLIIASLAIGVKKINWLDIATWNNSEATVVFISRIPRTVALILAGVGLSVSGLIMQQISLNKFVSPTTAGTLDAAKLGILISMILLPGMASIYQMGFAFLFTVLASIVFMQLLLSIKHKSLIYIPLLGIMFGNVLAAIGTFFAYKYDIVQNMETWMIGDFSKILKGNYELIYISLPVVILTYLYASKLTALGLGKDMAKNLGIPYNLMVLLGLICVSLTVSAVMITAGSIPFLGLIVPNIVSLFYGDNLKRSLPITALLGAILLLFSDIVSRLIIYPYEVPIGLTIGIIGGVTFLIFLRKRMRYA